MPLYIFEADGSSASAKFKIQSFSNDMPFNEKGTTVSAVTFDWSYVNGVPTSQSISPAVGVVPAANRMVTLGGQSIQSDTTFTLTATDGTTTRKATTHVRFVYPIYYGAVSSASPSEGEITALTKRVSDYEDFTVSLNLADEYSCFVSPMTNPITDIKADLGGVFLGLSVWDTYTVINNFPVTMADGVTVLCRVLVKSVPEHTSGQSVPLDIKF